MRKVYIVAIIAIAVFFVSPNVSYCGGDNKNHVALFNGITTGSSYGPYYSFGVDYERHLSDMWGIGAFSELIFGSNYASIPWIIGVPVFAHFDSFKVLAAPSLEMYQIQGLESSTYFLFRVGAGYDLHLGSLSLTPGVNIDFVNGKTLIVAGISVGLGF